MISPIHGRIILNLDRYILQTVTSNMKAAEKNCQSRQPGVSIKYVDESSVEQGPCLAYQGDNDQPVVQPQPALRKPPAIQTEKRRENSERPCPRKDGDHARALRFLEVDVRGRRCEMCHRGSDGGVRSNRRSQSPLPILASESATSESALLLLSSFRHRHILFAVAWVDVS